MNENNNPIDLPLGLTNLNKENINKDITKRNQTMLDREIGNILNEFPVVPPKKENNIVPKKQPPEESKKEKNKFKFIKKKQKTNVPKLSVDEKPIKPIEPINPEPIKPKPGKKKLNMMIPVSIILALIIIVALFITQSCDCPTDVVDLDSAETLAVSIKDQIITQGYAEVIVNNMTLKLAPYTG